MPYYYYSYCPYCDRRLTRGKTSLKTSGPPIKKCPECGKTYCDPNCFEPALTPYKPLSLPQLLRSSLAFGFLSALLAFAIATFFTESLGSVCTVAAIAFAAGFLFYFLFLLLRRNSIEERRLKQWQESDRRLRDPNYAARLKNAGFEVPSHYLSTVFRLDSEPVPPNPRVKRKFYFRS